MGIDESGNNGKIDNFGKKTKNYDQDELLILNALNSVHTPEFDILEGVEAKMTKKGLLKKGMVAAIVAISLISTTAVAAQFIGSFDRLQGIIGQNEADLLTPIEIATDNEGQSVVYDGIRAEVVAVGVFGNIVDVYFTLEDIVANRLDNFFVIHPGLRPLDYENFPMGATIGSSGQPEIIHRDENGKVTIHARHSFGASLTGQQLLFTIDDIRYDLIDEIRPVDVDLSEFATEATSVLFQTDYDDPFGSSLWGIGLFRIDEDGGFHDFREIYQEQIRNEGFPILPPNELEIGFGVNEIRTSISNIGVVEDRLHVQLSHPDFAAIREEQNWEGSASVHLFRGELAAPIASLDVDWDAWEDKIVRPHVVMRFDMDENGTFAWWDGGTSYEEFVFDIDVANIHEYTMIVSYFSNGTMNLSWMVSLDLDEHYKQLEKTFDIDVTVGDSVLTQVSANPFGLLITGEGHSETFRYVAVTVNVHTTNGVVAANPPEFGSQFAPVVQSRWLLEPEVNIAVSGRFSFGQMIDLDSILSIEINGVHIELE